MNKFCKNSSTSRRRFRGQFSKGRLFINHLCFVPREKIQSVEEISWLWSQKLFYVLVHTNDVGQTRLLCKCLRRTGHQNGISFAASRHKHGSWWCHIGVKQVFWCVWAWCTSSFHCVSQFRILQGKVFLDHFGNNFFVFAWFFTQPSSWLDAVSPWTQVRKK